MNELDNLTGRKIVTRRCAVYGNGLSRSATLMLAKQHNELNQIQRITTFTEVAACCRRLVFSHFAETGAVDDGTTTPTIPRYNSQPYISFKQECVTYLLSSQTVSYIIGYVLSPQVEVKYILITVESGNDRSGHSDGTIEETHLSQDAGCV